MKNILYLLILVVSSCGVSPTELRTSSSQEFTTIKSRDEIKVCLLDELAGFRPDRIVISDFSNRTEIFIGALQAGKFRNYYLFNIQDKKVFLSKYDGYYFPLSSEQATTHIINCLK